MRTLLLLVMTLALVLAGCSGKPSGEDDGTPPYATPTISARAVVVDSAPTELSQWRNLTGEFMPGDCQEIVLPGKGAHRQASWWLVVRKGAIGVTGNVEEHGYVEKIACTYSGTIIPLTKRDVRPEDGLVNGSYSMPYPRVTKFLVQCESNAACDFSFHAQVVGALEALQPVTREEVGHIDAGACKTIPLEGMADHPGFNVNGFFDPGSGSIALLPTGHEESYCSSGTGATHESSMETNVWGHIDPVPFQETDRMSLVVRCVGPPAGCDHRLSLLWGALATPRYDAEVGPAPTA